MSSRGFIGSPSHAGPIAMWRNRRALASSIVTTLLPPIQSFFGHRGASLLGLNSFVSLFFSWLFWLKNNEGRRVSLLQWGRQHGYRFNRDRRKRLRYKTEKNIDADPWRNSPADMLEAYCNLDSSDFLWGFSRCDRFYGANRWNYSERCARSRRLRYTASVARRHRGVMQRQCFGKVHFPVDRAPPRVALANNRKRSTCIRFYIRYEYSALASCSLIFFRLASLLP